MRLLGRAVGDRDWVVVGADARASCATLGYLAVGRDFPVFLHPETREEHALARTERKTGPGYHGFEFHADPRRDARGRPARVATSRSTRWREDEDGTLIDPHGGRRDLAAKVLRHVSPAFAEDPVRILRLARFAARFADFRVAAETEALMRAMVAHGEVDALVPERVWQELSRGLMEDKPSRMFEVLRGCGALARVLPEVDRLFGVPQRADHHPEVDTGVHLMMVLDMAARLATSARRPLRLPRPRPRQGNDAGRDPAAPPAPRGAQRRAGARDERAAARRQRLPRARRSSSRASTATSIAAASSAPPRSCACSSAATRCAGPIASPRRCSRASATRAAASASRTSRIRSARGCADALARVDGRRRHRVAADAAARGLAGPGDRRGDPRRARQGARRPRLARRRARRRRAGAALVDVPRAGGGGRRSAKPIGANVAPLANASTLNSSPISCSWTSFERVAARRAGPTSASSSPRPQLRRKRACDV